MHHPFYQLYRVFIRLVDGSGFVVTPTGTLRILDLDNELKSLTAQMASRCGLGQLGQPSPTLLLLVCCTTPVLLYNAGTDFLYQENSMTISASEARQRLFPLLEQVNNDHEPVRIASRSGDAVLMSAADYDSWQETVYLLRSPENARRLMEAVARDKAATSSVSTSIPDLAEIACGQE